jgi:hypothetical protein
MDKDTFKQDTGSINTYITNNVEIDRQYFYKDADEPEDQFVKGKYRIKYITYYEMHRGYIWGGILFFFFMIFYLILLFAFYLRVNAYQSGACAPFSLHDFDVKPCTDSISAMYWKEAFETMSKENNLEKRKKAKRRHSTENGLLANLWDVFDILLLIPKSIWNVGENLRDTIIHINTEIARRTDPYYYRFAAGLQRMVNPKKAEETDDNGSQ